MVANLFTLEYFQLAASRLEPEGIYCQWLPYHMLTNDDVTMMLKTFGSAFPHAQLWKVPDGLDLILLGSREPLVAPKTVQQRVAALNHSGPNLEYVLSRESDEIAAIAADPRVPLNTDDRPILEFHAARNLLIGDLGLLEPDSEDP
jgi:spermidine synthase